MKKKKSLISACLVLLAVTMVFVSTSEAEYPEKPIRLIVPYPPGGNTDILARTIQNKMSESIGQRIIIESRGGAGSRVGSEYVARSAPDGYTILLASSAHVINPCMIKKMPYDTIKDFAGISIVVKVPGILVAHPSVSFRTPIELITYAKANPGKLNFASSGQATIGALAAELLMLKENIEMVHVPYKGNGPAMTDLIGGHTDMFFSSIPSAIGHVRSGRLVAIGLVGYNRSPAAPDVPTFEEFGISGCEVVSGFSLYAPSKTPKAIINTLNASVVKALEDPRVKKTLENLGAEPSGCTPAETDEFTRKEIAKFKDVVKKAGIEPQ